MMIIMLMIAAFLSCRNNFIGLFYVSVHFSSNFHFYVVQLTAASSCPPVSERTLSIIAFSIVLYHFSAFSGTLILSFVCLALFCLVLHEVYLYL